MTNLELVEHLFKSNPRYQEYELAFPIKRPNSKDTTPQSEKYLVNSIWVGELFSHMGVGTRSKVKTALHGPNWPNLIAHQRKHHPWMVENCHPNFNLFTMDVVFNRKAKPVYEQFGDRLATKLRHRFGEAHVDVATEDDGLNPEIFGQADAAKISVAVHIPKNKEGFEWAAFAAEYYYQLIQIVYQTLGI